MYKVIKSFNDKYTQTKYKVGDEVFFTDKRAKEILSVGNLIEKIEETEEVVETVDETVSTKKKNKKK